MSKIKDGLKSALRYSKLKAVYDALEFYASMDNKAGLPAGASPALPAMTYTKEFMDECGTSETISIRPNQSNKSVGKDEL